MSCVKEWRRRIHQWNRLWLPVTLYWREYSFCWLWSL